MSKFISVVKFKVKAEEENNFIEAMNRYNLPEGLIYRKLIKTGDYSYCSIIGKRTSIGKCKTANDCFSRYN